MGEPDSPGSGDGGRHGSQAPRSTGSASSQAVERAALEAAGIGLVRTSLDGVILEADRAALRIIDAEEVFPDPSVLHGRQLRGLYPFDWDAWKTAADHVKGREGGRLVNQEQRIDTPKGRHKWILYDTFVVTDHATGKPALQFVLRDITALKQAEDALAESKAVLRAVLDSLPFDLFALDREGRYILQNSVCRNNWGAIVGKRPEDLNVDEHTLALWRENNRRALSGEQVRAEEQFDVNGRPCTVFNIIGPIRDRGEITGVLGINVDISERKAAEQRYRELHDNVPVGVFRAAPDGTLLSVNPAVLRILGFASAEEAARVDIGDLFVDPEQRQALLHSLNERGAVEDFETEIKRTDGTSLWCSVSATTVRNREDQIEHYDGILQDISVSKRMEAQLRQAVKMKAIGRLAGGIAHDFNNLLTGILGHASMLRLRVDADETLEHSANAIEQAAKRAHELTQQLLGFARRGKYRREAVDVHQTIREVHDLLVRAGGQNVRIELRLDAERATVTGDPGRLHQALLNLAINALDAMPDGGVLTLATELVAPGAAVDGAIAADATATPDETPARLSISVRDTGCGVPESIRRRIFEPFFTTKEDEGGAGMGLAMVYGIVEHHHGTIAVSDRPGGGAVFTMQLPLSEKAAAAVMRSKSRAPPGSGGVLVVDDDPLVRKAATALLEELGYRVYSAESGEQALRIYREHRRQISLVLLDMVMPVMDGRQCADALRSIDAKVRILFSTGYSVDQSVQETLAAGVAGFIRKPYSLGDLAKAVREALAP